MASPAGRGAQVILDGAAQAAARGAAGDDIAENTAAKRALEEAGDVPDGTTVDGSTLTGLPAEDRVLGPAASSNALDAMSGSDNTFAVTTTDETPTNLTADGSAGAVADEILVPADTVFRFRLEVAARDIDTGDAAGWLVTGLVKRGALVSNMAFIDTPTVTGDYADAGAAAWDFDVSLDTTNGGMLLTATGAADTTIQWVARVFTTECG